jgi:hypothetical protein
MGWSTRRLSNYLMRRLPAWHHKYFPKEFDWKAKHDDRRTKVEFTYRPAYTRKEWSWKMPPTGDGIHAYDLCELPWYSEYSATGYYSWFSDSNEDEWFSDSDEDELVLV